MSHSHHKWNERGAFCIKHANSIAKAFTYGFQRVRLDPIKLDLSITSTFDRAKTAFYPQIEVKTFPCAMATCNEPCVAYVTTITEQPTDHDCNQCYYSDGSKVIKGVPCCSTP
jgi:hypothetical protein